MPYGTDVGLGQGNIVLGGDPAPPHGKGHSSPRFSAHVYCGRMVAYLSNRELLLRYASEQTDI